MSDEVLERPTHGVRLVARHDAASGDGAYELAVATAAGSWRGRATVGTEDGAVSFSAWEGGEPQPWAVAALHALLRSAWQRRRAGEPWPRRLTRWRPAPTGAGDA